jgi:hypothetical protein
MARPRTPIAIKAARGDTRQRGALQHAESIAAAFMATRGAPPQPEDFEPQKRGEDEDVAAWKTRESIRARARKHWDYLMGALDRDGLLAVSDQGILATCCWCYSLLTEAALRGDIKGVAALQAAYNTSSNLAGLNESARAKIPKQNTPQMTEQEMALAAGLPDEDQPIQ